MNIEYSTKEVAELFAVSKDTIRYYEKLNLINPERKENNYRVFGDKEISRLSIIRYFLSLNISLESIHYYLDNQNFKEIMFLLEEHKANLNMEYEKISLKLEGINRYLKYLKEIRKSEVKLNTLVTEWKEDRYYYTSNEKHYSYTDFIIKLRMLFDREVDDKEGMNVVYTGGIVNYEKEEINYSGQFIISPFEKAKNIMVSGIYVSYFFKRKSIELLEVVKIIIFEVQKKGYEIKQPFYEFYLIDYYETSDDNDYLTEIQVRIEKI